MGKKLEKRFEKDGIPVLLVSVSYPEFKLGQKSAERRINRYYARIAFSYFRFASRDLLKAANTEYAYCTESGHSFMAFEAEMSYRVTEDSDEILSLYIDLQEKAFSSHPLHLRFGDTWEKASGFQLELGNFCGFTRLKKRVLSQVSEKARRQDASGQSIYYDSYLKLIARYFSKRNFYIENGRTAVFFQPLTIAPRAEGVPVFLVSI